MKIKVSRRQLIKGALATPLVLTVRSAAGTGMAMTSAGACKLRDKDRYYDEKPDKFKTTAGADEWLRKECQIVKIEKYVNYRWTSVDGDYFLGDTKCYWQLVRDSTGCNCYQKSDYTTSNCRVTQNVRKEYGLVCIDEWGNTKGWCWEHPEYQPVTGSCWASLKIT